MNVEDNLRVWQQDYDWSGTGDEWSAPWGSSEVEWYWTLLPRIHKFVPCGTVLEIAPGFGRWTHFLRHLCDRLEVVDLTPRCIEHCRNRFKDSSNVSYHVNDGRTLGMIADHSVDFAFSFDSLVHVEADVIDGYLQELSRVLSPDGVGFLHHSNLAGCQRNDSPDSLRAASVSAEGFRASCQRHHLSCISQELLNWAGQHALDCISVITPEASKLARPTKLVDNVYFAHSDAWIRLASEVY
jgi:ubiquinone/menaquinone biosynthesis C-methylase UbiE